MIRDFIFRDKFIDIKTLEVESRLKRFWLELNNGDYLLGIGFHEYLGMDHVYPCTEENLKKKLNYKDWAPLKITYLKASS